MIRVGKISLVAQMLLLLTLTVGCTGIDGPAKTEPAVTIESAGDVSRTTARLTATLSTEYIHELDGVTFSYGEGTAMNFSAEATVDGLTASAELKGLKPGTEYIYRAECHYGPATVVSETGTFITESNRRPVMGTASILATGPTSVAIGVTVDDDGGEAISTAWVRVDDLSDGSSRKADIDPLPEAGVRRIVRLTGFTAGHRYTLTPAMGNSMGTAEGEALQFDARQSIMLAEAGMLPKILGEDAFGMEELSFSGVMNGTDLRWLRHVLGAEDLSGGSTTDNRLRSIDLAEVTIAAGGDSYDGSHFTESDVLTTGLLADCPHMERVKLPLGATRMMKDAVAGSPVETIVIGPAMTDIEPSARCGALLNIEVSAGNDKLTSTDGVLFDAGGTELIWFPGGKTGAYALPSRTRRLRSGAFSGSGITGVDLRGGVTNIPMGLLQGCTELTTVRLGEKTEYIGDYWMDGCGKLTDIYLDAAIPPVLAERALTNSAAGGEKACTLHVPAASAALYRAHPKWGGYFKITSQQDNDEQ